MERFKKMFFVFKLLSFVILVTIILTGCTGKQGEQGEKGERGEQGVAGKDGETPTITINKDGYWVINGEVTEFQAVASEGKNGVNGKDGKTPTITINKDGYWVINGVVTNVKATGNDGKPGSNGTDGSNGKDGETPVITINKDGYWVINGKVTEYKATGNDGKNGEDGKTPTITINEEGYWVINGVVTEYKAVGKDGEVIYVPLEAEYEIGEEVVFNPGDQDRTWNVIGESADTVTLMLTKNLGNEVAWITESDYGCVCEGCGIEESCAKNDKGPLTAITYLNNSTINWSNVENIKDYNYLDNLNGTSKPNGYQVFEIDFGVTKFTTKSGDIIKVPGETKARIISKEELLEISSKTNKNLKQENLIAYIERNLNYINASMGLSLTKVEEVLQLAISIEPSLQYESKNIQVYFTVYILNKNYGIEPTYDISLPDYLLNNIEKDGYWTLSSRAASVEGAWGMKKGIGIEYANVVYMNGYGVRPVITIPKSKLLEA